MHLIKRVFCQASEHKSKRDEDEKKIKTFPLVIVRIRPQSVRERENEKRIEREGQKSDPIKVRSTYSAVLVSVGDFAKARVGKKFKE